MAYKMNGGKEPGSSYKNNSIGSAFQQKGLVGDEKKWGKELTSKEPQRMPTIPPQNPGVYKGVDLKKRPAADDSSEVFWRKTAHGVATDKPVDSEGKPTKGISRRAYMDLMHLERHGQTGRLTSGPLSSPTEKIEKGFRKGWDEYLKKPD